MFSVFSRNQVLVKEIERRLQGKQSGSHIGLSKKIKRDSNLHQTIINSPNNDQQHSKNKSAVMVSKQNMAPALALAGQVIGANLPMGSTSSALAQPPRLADLPRRGVRGRTKQHVTPLKLRMERKITNIQVRNCLRMLWMLWHDKG